MIHYEWSWVQYDWMQYHGAVCYPDSSTICICLLQNKPDWILHVKRNFAYFSSISIIWITEIFFNDFLSMWLYSKVGWNVLSFVVFLSSLLSADACSWYCKWTVDRAVSHASYGAFPCLCVCVCFLHVANSQPALICGKSSFTFPLLLILVLCILQVLMEVYARTV